MAATATEKKLLIDGEWVETGEWIEVHSPYSGELARLDVDRRPREATIPAAMVEMQVRVDHERDAVD